MTVAGTGNLATRGTGRFLVDVKDQAELRQVLLNSVEQQESRVRQ
jgi:hypothetical protein